VHKIRLEPETKGPVVEHFTLCITANSIQEHSTIPYHSLQLFAWVFFDKVIIQNTRLPNVLEIIQQVRARLLRKHPEWFTLDPKWRLKLTRRCFAKTVGFYNEQHAQKTTFAAQCLIKAMQKEHGQVLSNEFHDRLREREQRSIHDFTIPYVAPPVMVNVDPVHYPPLLLYTLVETDRGWIFVPLFLQLIQLMHLML